MSRWQYYISFTRPQRVNGRRVSGERSGEAEELVRCTRVLGGRMPGLYRWLPTGKHRAAASALSSGRVLKAITAPGAPL